MSNKNVRKISQAVLDYISTLAFDEVCDLVDRGYFKDYEIDEIEGKLQRYVIDIEKE